LRDVNIICRRNWYIAAHIWKIYIPRHCQNIFCLCKDNGERWISMKWKCIKIRRSTTMSKIFFVNVWHKCFWHLLCEGVSSFFNQRTI
jgi:hypothetical protein